MQSTRLKNTIPARVLAGQALSQRGWTPEGAGEAFVRELGHGDDRQLLRVALMDDGLGGIQLIGVGPDAQVSREVIGRDGDVHALAARFARDMLLSTGQKLARGLLSERMSTPAHQPH